MANTAELPPAIDFSGYMAMRESAEVEVPDVETATNTLVAALHKTLGERFDGDDQTHVENWLANPSIEVSDFLVSTILKEPDLSLDQLLARLDVDLHRHIRDFVVFPPAEFKQYVAAVMRHDEYFLREFTEALAAAKPFEA